jgi:hypothetical protein
MNRYFLLVVMASFFSFSHLRGQSGRENLKEKIDTAHLDFKVLAANITGEEKDNYKKAQLLLNWLTNRLEWKATDYKRRTVKEIIARGGGNCFELANVYIALVKASGIQYRSITEINIQPLSERRQKSAEARVATDGFRSSVFGLQHNDHRWIEIYDEKSKSWQPADPSMNVIGTGQWLKARAWFGQRITIDTAITNAMIVPFAVFVVEANSLGESRTQHYLVDEFNKLYNYQLSSLAPWREWVRAVDELQLPARNAFENKENLHLYNNKIAALAKIYQQLKEAYAKKFP